MPLPMTSITDVPPGNACVFRFMRTGKGFRKFTAGGSYACPPYKTVRVPTLLHLDLALPAQAGCDETGQLFPGPLTLDSQGTTIYRDDKFGFFFGLFSLVSAGTGLFRGRIELFDKSTIQQAPLVAAGCDLKCQPAERLEGWLVAGGVAASTDKMTIRAVLGAVGTLPSLGQAVQLGIQNLVTTGVVVRG